MSFNTQYRRGSNSDSTAPPTLEGVVKESPTSTVHRVHSRPIVTWLAMAAVSLSATFWTAPAAAQPQKEKVIFTVDVAEELFNPTLVKPTDTQPERFVLCHGREPLSSGHDSG